MTQKQSTFTFYLLFTALIAYAAAKITHNGDFIGYVNVGNLVLNKQNIYDDMFNTWPPVFSILSVPLSFLNNISFIGVRILWMIVLFYCIYYCFKVFIQIQQKSTGDFKSIFGYIKKPQYLLILFLSMRPFMDNLMYLQINPVMLAICVFALFQLNHNGKYAPITLGFSIGSKIYNLFLIPLYIIFKEWKQLILIFIGIGLTFLLCISVFGLQLSIDYHQHWVNQIASSVQTIEHRNQSFFGALLRLFTIENRAINNFPYLIDLGVKNVQKLYYLIILGAAMYFLINYRKQIKLAQPDFKIATFILIITIVPLLTPLAWKANYIYAIPAHFYIVNLWMNRGLNKGSQIMYVIACLLLNLSNEALISSEGMYFAEKCNVLVIGQILLVIVLFKQLHNMKKADHILEKAD